MPQPTNDPFDDLLTLEDTLYTSAYALGTQDGARAGRIEGRVFGLEKGFEKFAALGALHGRAVVWGARLPTQPNSHSSPPSPQNPVGKEVGRDGQDGQESQGTKDTTEIPQKDTEYRGKACMLPLLTPNSRLQKHIHTLHALSDPQTFSTLNTEDAVADLDDRSKRAGAKAKIVERIIGESSSAATGPSAEPTSTSPLRDARSPKRGAKARNVRLDGEGKKRGDDSMEDFTGSRFLS